MLAPSGELAPPPRGNPGSATGSGCQFYDLKGDNWLEIVKYECESFPKYYEL